MKCYLTCPSHGALVKIDFDRSSRDGRIAGVKDCHGALRVDLRQCDETCVELINTKIDQRERERVRERPGREQDRAKSEAKR